MRLVRVTSASTHSIAHSGDALGTASCHQRSRPSSSSIGSVSCEAWRRAVAVAAAAAVVVAAASVVVMMMVMEQGSTSHLRQPLQHNCRVERHARVAAYLRRLG